MSLEDPDSLGKNGRITIRELEIDDLSPVYRLGERLFTRSNFPVLYRTWDSFEVTHYYATEPEYCLVAVDSCGSVVGFALGSIIEKDGTPWKYGYLAWLGVAPEYQGRGVAQRLLREFEKRMKDDGARILLVDTEADNQRAISFFQSNGFAQPKSHVWLSKSLTRHHKQAIKPMKPVTALRRRKKTAPTALQMPSDVDGRYVAEEAAD